MRIHTAALRSLLLSLVLVLAGCATTPSTGSRTWHENRLAEIETAYQNEEISDEAYISLKNEADAVRVEYQNASRSRMHYGGYPSFPSHRVNHHHHRPRPRP